MINQIHHKHALELYQNSINLQNLLILLFLSKKFFTKTIESTLRF